MVLFCLSGTSSNCCGRSWSVSDVFCVVNPARPANGMAKPAARAPESTLTPRNMTTDWTTPRSSLSLTRMLIETTGSHHWVTASTVSSLTVYGQVRSKVGGPEQLTRALQLYDGQAAY